MKSLFLSPHDDDQALFGAFTCIREKPLVCIVTDSYIQQARGEKGCSPEDRAKETEEANKILGCKTLRLGLHDDTVTQDQIEKEFDSLHGFDIVYAPALQGGSPHHDMVSIAATKRWGAKVVYYTTYTKTELHTTGEQEIIPTPEETEIKNKALDCYVSQRMINFPHFQSIYGKNEWLIGKKLRKVFILTQFGGKHSWSDQYIQHLERLGERGWYWKIFTPNKYENVPWNVEIIDMTIEQFNVMAKAKIGVDPANYLTEEGFPKKNVSDYYVASGQLFEDYIRGFDYWGMTNWDVVYGDLSRFIPDHALSKMDVFTDDVNTINGVFCLFRNIQELNNLFREIPDWEEKFTTHKLFGTDEYDMTTLIRSEDVKKRFKIGYPEYYPLHSHDRLEHQVPEVKLEIKSDGSLWELLKDVAPPDWEHARPFIGRQIMYYHFLRTKEWPKCLKSH